jgi:hypothetical protein
MMTLKQSVFSRLILLVFSIRETFCVSVHNEQRRGIGIFSSYWSQQLEGTVAPASIKLRIKSR